MVKGVPSEGMGLFFLWFPVFSFRFSVKDKYKTLTQKKWKTISERQDHLSVFYPKTENRKPKTAFQSFYPGGRRAIRPGRQTTRGRRTIYYGKIKE
jgi:hypothetical protein